MLIDQFQSTAEHFDLPPPGPQPPFDDVIRTTKALRHKFPPSKNLIPPKLFCATKQIAYPERVTYPPFPFRILTVVKDTGDNFEGTKGGLDAIVESSPRKEDIPSARQVANSAGTISRKKSIPAVIRGNVTTVNSSKEETVKGNGTGQVTAKDTLRDIKTKPRPISISGIPSPSPGRSSSTMSTRRDKYGTLAGGEPRLRSTVEPRLRRTMSVRSVSDGHVEQKLGLNHRIEQRLGSNGTTHSRMASRDSSVSITSSTTVVPSRGLKGVLHGSGQNIQKPTTTTTQALTKQKHTIETTMNRPQELSKSGIPVSPKSLRAGNTIPSPSPRDPSKLSSHKPLPRHQPKDSVTRSPHQSPEYSKPIDKSLRPQPSRPTLPKLTTSSTGISSPSLKSHLSKEFSPSPSLPSTPKLHSKPSTAILTQKDISPDQHRLLQLLHLIPLSRTSLQTYESSAHTQLSARYRALQERFERTQEHDHAMTLMAHLEELRMWTEGHIRSLAGGLGEWECLVGDLRGFIKRLVSTLKPVNKSVLQEKDRLLSRLNDIEMTLAGLPGTGVPGIVCNEIRENLGLLRKEMDMAITVAGLRWRSEVLQVEVKRMEIFNRMALGKSAVPGGQGICVWRE